MRALLARTSALLCLVVALRAAPIERSHARSHADESRFALKRARRATTYEYELPETETPATRLASCSSRLARFAVSCAIRLCLSGRPPAFHKAVRDTIHVTRYPAYRTGLYHGVPPLTARLPRRQRSSAFHRLAMLAEKFFKVASQRAWKALFEPMKWKIRGTRCASRWPLPCTGPPSPPLVRCISRAG